MDPHLPEIWLGVSGQGSVWSGAVAALLLGLRHATDPDHITAVSTLVVSDRQDARERAARLGLAWGLGHATTLFLFGLPVVLFGAAIPEAATRGAEIAIGALITVLAVRLLVRWKRGYLHVHPHEHDGIRHSHPHMHEHVGRAHPSASAHAHRHLDTLGRTSRESFGVGLVHGVGGSAGAGILVAAAASTPAAAILALFCFATGTALSMGAVSALVGHGLGTTTVARHFERVVPILGIATGAFGIWYVASTF